jgi:hypothetical protein
MDEPVYKHDCSACIFLGTYRHDGTRYDLYYCNKGIPTVIARYGIEEKYMSGIQFGLSDIMSNNVNMSPLGKALQLAYKKDLIKIKITSNE